MFAAFLTLSNWVIFHAFFFYFSADSFKIDCFENYFPEIPSECQTVLDPDQTRRFVGSDLGPNRLQKLSQE